MALSCNNIVLVKQLLYSDRRYNFIANDDYRPGPVHVQSLHLTAIKVEQAFKVDAVIHIKGGHN